MKVFWRLPIWLVVGCVVVVPLRFSLAQVSGSVEAAARKLYSARVNLQKAPGKVALEQAFIDSFPQTYSDFLQLFDYGRPLSDGHDYMQTLQSLTKTHELTVGKLLVQLSKDAHYEADAPSYLQHTTAVYGRDHTSTFASLLDQLTLKERSNLIVFLADVENHAADSDYEKIVERLRSLNQVELTRQFEAARRNRKMNRSH